jgi:hypothetical protein
MLPIPLIALGVLAGGAYLAKRHANKKKSNVNGETVPGVLTSERQVIYDTAMNQCHDPNQILKVAAAMEGEGLKDHAAALRKRAALRTLPKNVKMARRAVFKQMMACKDKQRVLRVADALQAEGATGSAEALRKYASGLEG